MPQWFCWLTAECPTRLNFTPSFIHHLHQRSFSFLVEEDVTNYTDDTTSYSNGKNVVTVLENIETNGKEVFSCFSINFLKANPDKSQLLLTSKSEASIKTDDTDIKSKSSKKLLVVLTSMFLRFAKK